MPSLPADKTALRRYYRGLRGALSEAHRQSRSADMLRHLDGHPLLERADTVLLYAPLGSEADLLPLVATALSLGKTVGFPVSHPEDHTLTFHGLTELGQLRVGAYGIREPDPLSPPLTAFSEALCLVPALAYDRFGYRLGYGGGYYDRFLSAFAGTSLGVCFGDCLCDRLPIGPYDRRVDGILTEGGIRTPDEAT